MPAYSRSGSAISVNTQTSGDQLRSSITRLADGSLIVTWQTNNSSQDGSGAAIMMRRYSATGAVLSEETVVNSSVTGDQIRSQVTALASGGYVVTWETADATRDGNGSAIMARIYDSGGVAIATEFRANSLATADQRQPTVAGLADGSFVVIWHTTDATLDGQGWSLRGQRFDANGGMLGAEFRVNTSAFGSQNNADVAVLSDGRFVVTWQHGASGSSETHAQVYNANGTAQGGQITVGSFAGEFDSSVAALSDGGFVVAFHRGGGVFFQRYDVNRAAVGGQVYVGDGLLPEISALTEGGFVVAWRSDSVTTLARAYSATGTATSSAFTLAADGNSGVEASIVNLAGGGFAASWTAGNSGSGTGQDIRLGIFQPQANAAPELGAATRNIAVAENATAIATVVATDDGGPSPVSYSIIGGADAARFAVNGTTGALTFIATANFEAPTDAGANNVYDVVIQASDGALFDTQAIAVTVANVNEAPVITSNGAGISASISVVENGSIAASVTASDPENATLSYSISGGLDAVLFSINSATGVLSFLTAPNFEAPADSGANNVYNVTVRVSDGALADTQALAITVTDSNETPVISSNGGGETAALSLLEGEIAVTNVAAADPDNHPIGYAIVGGADAALFGIDAATGALRFVAAPDFETPADADGDGVYAVVVRASDGELTDDQAISVTVANLNEGLSIVSDGGGNAASIAVGENGVAVTTVGASDIDGDGVSYTIASGADAGLFAIDSATGELTFVDTPNFEAPGDADGDNVYEVTVSATDGSFFDTQGLAITIGNVNEGFLPGWANGARAAVENQTLVGFFSATDIDGDAVSYAITDGDDAALFTIDAATGALSFLVAPDYENPGSGDDTNSYDVFITASDGTIAEERFFNIIVNNDNEGLTITSNGGSATALVAMGENAVSVTTVTAVDQDGTVPYYAIVGGADAARFGITSTGILYFLSAPDFEARADAGGDNVYDVVVSASDGSFSDMQAIAVAVGNVNEGLSITSNGGGASAALDANENGTIAAIVAASDVDGDTVGYGIAGGADAARFAIDAATGVLSFLTAPNFEAPGDAGGDNVYDVVVSASDGSFTDTQALAISVRNVNEGVAITSNGGGSAAALAVAENSLPVTTVAATDADGTAVSYAIAGGADAARFSIDAQTGALRFVAAPNHEAPVDAGANNVYDLIVSASDGVFSDIQALAVTVTNVREGNTIFGTSANNTISTTTTVSGQPRATELEDTIYGLGGADTISGAGGADIIDGGTGNDIITGGLGADVLTGGVGADRFVYNLAAETAVGARDVITDFFRSQGDKISVNAIDANSNASGNQNFAFIGTSAFSGVAGQLRFEQTGGQTFVSGDVNGDRVADFMIELNGLEPLTPSDFIL